MKSILIGKGKAELGLQDNKAIAINSLVGIEIERFRSLVNQPVVLGERITVLSGRNGTMKTSLMGLLAHPFTSEAKDVFGKNLKTSLSDVFKFSPKFDRDDYKYKLAIKTDGNEILSEPVSIYYVAEGTNRHRVVVSGAEKGDGNFLYNTSFLNLKRLFPLVDSKAVPASDSSLALSDSEKVDLKDFYETVFPSTEYEEFVPLHQKDIKTTFALAGKSAKYDWHSISSGEDNLGAIFNRLLGFQRSLAKGQKTGNGILCIDEFESSLHPVAQLHLFEYLYKWSARYKVQIVISTHSLHLIQYLYLKHEQNLSARRIIVNFISKSSAADGNYPILQNPSYELAYKELTLSSAAKVAEARKIKVFCEDDYAIHFAKRLIKRLDILRTLDFHSSVNPASAAPGTSWTALRSLCGICIQFPLLVEGSLALFDADVGDPELAKIKNKDLYLVLPDVDGLAIERRMISFIIGLSNNDAFFSKFDKEREAFLAEFKTAGIKSLSLKDIVDEKKTPIEKCKGWADSDKSSFKKYITFYCDVQNLRPEFQKQVIARINTLNQAVGLPTIV